MYMTLDLCSVHHLCSESYRSARAVMGSCSSCEAATATAAAAGRATAKLVSTDGRLLEFAWPVRASDVLRKAPSDCFVCDADDMDFEDTVSAVGADEELQPGGLYFLLPASMLRRPLRADEMAALAVKASAALGASRGRRTCRGGSSAPLEFPTERSSGRTERCGDGALQVTDGQRRRRPNSARRRGGGKGRCFTSNLSAIPE